MNDQPDPAMPPAQPDSMPSARGEPERLDDTQRVEVPRFAPPPDPRPDARWAWASSGEQPASERWHDATSPQPGLPGRPGGTGWSGGSPFGAWDAPGGGSPASAPATPASDGYGVPPAPVHRRRGAVVGPVIAASLLSAILASGGTVVVLDRAGAFDRATVGGETGSVAPVTQQNVHLDESSAIIDASAKVSPAVVKITTDGQSSNPFGSGDVQGVGSGIIYNASGWILTNRHVVAGASKLTVELKDGRHFDGRVYGVDTLTDLAIVKIDQTGLPTAPIGRSDGLKIGQLVIAIGSPLGTYSFSVTSGIVSGKGRDIQVDNGTRITNLIQTDAAINPGNSGGPLIDATGEVVGVNTAVATDSSGIGFAIPIDIARPIMEQAVQGEALSRPWIGIRFESIDLQLKEDENLPVDNGAFVTSSGSSPAVQADSPADKAGVKDGDIVLAINGIQIDTEHPLDSLLVQFAPGDTVTLDVLRAGSSIQLKVALGTRPKDL